MSDYLGPYLLGPNDENQGIYTGDARELAMAIPDESVDLVLTDPPYLREYLHTYYTLAREAERVLKQGGYCLAYFGLEFLPEVTTALGTYLDWFWLLATQHMGNYPALWSKKIMAAWKPIAVYTKGKPTKLNWIVDWFNGEGKDKRYHEWGQGESLPTLVLDKLTNANDIILDPFTGGGTVPAVCKMLGRRWLAFEIDPATADKARERVRNTQPPLFVPEPQQIELFT